MVDCEYADNTYDNSTISPNWLELFGGTRVVPAFTTDIVWAASS